MIPGSPLFISAASVCSNLRSMATLMGAGILPVPRRVPQSADRDRSVRGGAGVDAQGLFGLTMSAQVGQHLRQLALERGACQPGRNKPGRIEVDAIAQQRAVAGVRRSEFPEAMVCLEVAAD